MTKPRTKGPSLAIIPEIGLGLLGAFLGQALGEFLVPVGLLTIPAAILGGLIGAVDLIPGITNPEGLIGAATGAVIDVVSTLGTSAGLAGSPIVALGPVSFTPLAGSVAGASALGAGLMTSVGLGGGGAAALAAGIPNAIIGSMNLISGGFGG